MTGKIFKENMAENLRNLAKHINLQIQKQTDPILDRPQRYPQ